MVNHFNYVHRSLTPSFIRKQTLCVTAVGEFVIGSALDISKEVFDSIPVCWISLGIKASKLGNRVGNIKACHHGKVLE